MAAGTCVSGIPVPLPILWTGLELELDDAILGGFGIVPGTPEPVCMLTGLGFVVVGILLVVPSCGTSVVPLLGRGIPDFVVGETVHCVPQFQLEVWPCGWLGV